MAGKGTQTPAYWYDGSPVPWTMRLLAPLYAGVAALRRRAYRRGWRKRHSLPVPVIVADPQVVWLGESIAFNGSDSWDPDGTVAFWFWNFDDGATSSEVALDHLFDSPGFYNVSLKVADDLNSIATGYLLVEVRNRLPHASFAIAPAEGNTTVEFGFADSSSDPDGTVTLFSDTFGEAVRNSDAGRLLLAAAQRAIVAR